MRSGNTVCSLHNENEVTRLISARMATPIERRYTMENTKDVRMVIKKGQKPTEKQIREIEAASKKTITPDEDAPELTLEQYAEMAELARQKRAKNNKPLISLRISPKTLAKAKATGKGYTGFLSRLLDNAIDDPELVSRSL